jgi:non-ribosomal peptide synthetase component F
VIRAEFGALYEACRQGRDAELAPVEWQYRQFAEWQRERLAGPRLERLQTRWLDRIGGAVPVALPDERDRVDRLTRTAALCRLPEQEQASEALGALAAAGRTTVASAALAVYFLQLALITGQDDLSISSIFANRVPRRSWKTVGLFAHSLPLRARLRWDEPVSALLSEAQQVTAGALADQELPMAMLPTGALNRATMVGISNLVFQVLPTRASGSGEAAGGGGRVTMLHGLNRSTGSRFDLEMVLAPDPTRLRGFLRYASDRFPADWVREFAAAYCDLILVAAADPGRSPRDLRALCGARMSALAGS